MPGEQEDLGFMSVSDLSPLCRLRGSSAGMWGTEDSCGLRCEGRLQIDGNARVWFPDQNGGADIYQAGRWNTRFASTK